jgi:hypothetical protein
MKAKSKYLSVLVMIVLALTLFAPNSALAASTVTVKPSDVGVSWYTALPLADTRTGGNVSFVMGPATSPSGIGSLQMTTTDANGSSNAKAQAVTGAYIGTSLSSITALNYYVYRNSISTNSAAQTISLNIAVDFVGDGTSFTTLVFEPVYQTGGVRAMQLDTWQLWDAYDNGNAVWWSTKPIPGVCDFNCFVPWSTILSNNPNAEVKGIFGFNVGSGWGGQFKGATDALTVGISGVDTTYDFEPELPCTTVCYVDAATGNDANGGASMGNAKKTIQAGIDAVSDGGEVRVLPGNYNETATNRFVLGTNGPHQFGLFIDKDEITVQGVNAGDVPITDYNALAASVTTNATNNFGASGIFVQGDNVTIAGLHIGPNIPGDNKTIEIIGDGFTLKDSHVDVPGGGSVYFGDWQFNTGANTSHLQSYTLDHNLIDQSTSVDIASGAGFSSPASGRQIVNNEFENADYWSSISFNGSGTGVPWFVQSVGGAVIQGNTFTNTFNGTDVRAAHIRVRGAVDDSQFDWTSYWTGNTFNKAVVTLVGAYPPFNVRQYNYTSGSYSFNVRRIGVNIQSGIDKAEAGDTVLVKDGTYPESPNIGKSLTLKSSAGRDATIIQLQSGPTYLGALTINGADVTVDGFTIAGFDGTATTLASTNIYVTNTPQDVNIVNNRIQVGEINTSSNGDDGFGLITTYNTSSDVENVAVSNNVFEPLNMAGTRAFYINPGVNNFSFANNEINGKFLRTAITQAKNGVVEENTLTGAGAAGSRSAGFGTWGYPDPTVYGQTLFKNNTMTGVGKGIAIFATNNVAVKNNFFLDNDVAVWVGDSTSLTFDPATISANENSMVNSSLFGAQNASAFPGTMNAEINWWGSNAAAAVAAEADGNVDFTPWLCSGTDTSPAPGFQPNLSTLCPYQFTGFFQPIDMNTVNIAKAGQTIPVKWRLTDANGLPISDPAVFVRLYTQTGSCSSSTPPDVVEAYSGSSGLQYLGDGYWQFNWKTLKSYAGTCRAMYIEFSGGMTSPVVYFQFK